MPDLREATVYFGGTFDPPHLGHLAVVRGLRQEQGLPVLVVPAGVPAHRRAPLAPAWRRAEMLELALAQLQDPAVSICRHELERSAPSFTVDTVAWLRRRGEPAAVLLALGADAAAGLPGWKEVKQLLGEVRLLLFERAGAELAAAAVLEQLTAQGLPTEGAEVSRVLAPAVRATTVRERLAAGEGCAGLLPPEVEGYIRVNRLYGTEGERSPSSGAG